MNIFEYLLISFLLLGIGGVYALFISSLILFYFLKKIFVSKLNIHVITITSIFPFLIVLVIQILFFYPSVDYKIIIVAIFTVFMLELLNKVKSRKIILIILFGLLVFFFPRQSGSGGMTLNSYLCSCLGIEGRFSGIDSHTNICYGIPLNCRLLHPIH